MNRANAVDAALIQEAACLAALRARQLGCSTGEIDGFRLAMSFTALAGAALSVGDLTAGGELLGIIEQYVEGFAFDWAQLLATGWRTAA